MSTLSVWYNLPMDYNLQRLKRLADTGGPDDIERYIRALERVVSGLPSEPPSTQEYSPPSTPGTGGYGLETIVHTLHGTQIRCEAENYESPGTDFIRVCDERGKEIVYWTMDEIQEEPGLIMHALVHYAAYGAPRRCTYCNEVIYNARHLSGAQNADWATSGGDFGCEGSPDTSEEGVGSHVPFPFPM